MARSLAQHAAEERVRYQAMTPEERVRRNRVSWEAAQRRFAKRLAFVRSFRCVECGSSDKIEWHHPEGDGVFENRLANLIRGPRSKMLAEMARCQPYCLKHHRREHARMRRAEGIYPQRFRPMVEVQYG